MRKPEGEEKNKIVLWLILLIIGIGIVLLVLETIQLVFKVLAIFAIFIAVIYLFTRMSSWKNKRTKNDSLV